MTYEPFPATSARSPPAAAAIGPTVHPRCYSQNSGSCQSSWQGTAACPSWLLSTLWSQAGRGPQLAYRGYSQHSGVSRHAVVVKRRLQTSANYCHQSSVETYSPKRNAQRYFVRSQRPLFVVDGHQTACKKRLPPPTGGSELKPTRPNGIFLGRVAHIKQNICLSFGGCQRSGRCCPLSVRQELQERYKYVNGNHHNFVWAIFAITLEHKLHINKAASALVGPVVCCAIPSQSEAIASGRYHCIRSRKRRYWSRSATSPCTLPSKRSTCI